MADQPFTDFLPPEMRKLAEQNLQQAKKTFEEVMNATHRAVSSFGGHASTAQSTALELQRKVVGYSERNVAVSLEYAQNLLRAKDAGELGGWGRPLARPRGRGIAASFANESYVAHVVDVTVTADRAVRIDRVTSVVEGQGERAVRPESVAAGVFGLIATLSALVLAMQAIRRKILGGREARVA